MLGPARGEGPWVDLDLVEICAQLRACALIDELAALFAMLVAQIGMTASASGMLTGPRALGGNPIHFRNWDPAWLALYEARGFLSVDPLIRWPIVSGEPAAWSDIYARFRPGDPGHEVLKAARAFGYREGYVTPVRTRAGSLGLVSVGGDRRTGFTAAERLFLETSSTTLLRHAEALLAPEEPVAPGFLTPREQECLALVRMGLTDAEIARVLSLSQSTVRGHVDQARIKLGARNRTQLAVTILP